MIEAGQTDNISSIGHDVARQDVLSRQEEVLDLLLVELFVQLESATFNYILPEIVHYKLSNFRDIGVDHWSDTIEWQLVSHSIDLLVDLHRL